ncbi:MAG: IS66 family insertion sequence element accessory protein TnpB [Flavobacteriaceae bacterium]|nr:IS66 family insertion sequence element accessory protein TnpB [Flavobacteriaceae bacterium]
MIGFTSHHNYYIYTEITDMRKGYNGLSGLVRNKMEADPINGDVYVFFNRNRQLMKMLVWDHDGYAIYSKRLEKGTFECITDKESGPKYTIQYNHLIMLLSGISLLGMKQRPRYKMQPIG